MPSKSKRNRRPISKRTVSGSSAESITTTPEGINAQSAITQSEKISTTGKVSKTTVVEAPVGAYFASEVKWIAVVTAIIIILLIASYYIFR